MCEPQVNNAYDAAYNDVQCKIFSSKRRERDKNRHEMYWMKWERQNTLLFIVRGTRECTGRGSSCKKYFSFSLEILRTFTPPRFCASERSSLNFINQFNCLFPKWCQIFVSCKLLAILAICYLFKILSNKCRTSPPHSWLTFLPPHSDIWLQEKPTKVLKNFHEPFQRRPVFSELFNTLTLFLDCQWNTLWHFSAL